MVAPLTLFPALDTLTIIAGYPFRKTNVKRSSDRPVNKNRKEVVEGHSQFFKDSSHTTIR